jgi:uncharacterized protein YjbJ (UPF0337 family)
MKNLLDDLSLNKSHRNVFSNQIKSANAAATTANSVGKPLASQMKANLRGLGNILLKTPGGRLVAALGLAAPVLSYGFGRTTGRLSGAAQALDAGMLAYNDFYNQPGFIHALRRMMLPDQAQLAAMLSNRIPQAVKNRSQFFKGASYLFQKKANAITALTGSSKILPTLGNLLKGFGKRVTGGTAEYIGDIVGKDSLRNWGKSTKLSGKMLRYTADHEINKMGWVPKLTIGGARMLGVGTVSSIPYYAFDKIFLPDPEKAQAAARRQGEAEAIQYFASMPFLKRMMMNDPEALYRSYLQYQAQMAANPFANNRGNF